MKPSRLIFIVLCLLIGLLAISLAGCAKKQIKDETPMIEETIASEDEAVEDYDYIEESPDFIPESNIGASEVSGRTQYAPSSYNFRNVYFEFDKSNLTNEAKQILRSNAGYLVNNPNLRIRIEGHCDERGTEEYNLALGERRARSAYNYLKALGANSRQMAIISYGESRPVDPGHSERAWGKNRRAHFTVLAR